MRSKFIPQMTLGVVPIAEIEFDVFSRHELVPILMALQHLYVNRPQVLEKICALIQADISRRPKKTDRRKQHVQSARIKTFL